VLIAGVVVGILLFQGKSTPTTLGSTTQAATAHPTLTLAMADEAVNQIWPEFAGDANSADFKGIETFASPEVAALTVALELSRTFPWDTSYDSVEISAPSERRYPLSFFAEIDQDQGTGRASIDVLVLERPSAGYGGDNKTIGRSTVNAPADPGSALPTYPFQGFAALLQSERVTGHAPSGNPWDSAIAIPNASQTVYAQSYAEAHQFFIGQGDTSAGQFKAVDYSQTFAALTGSVSCAMITASVMIRSRSGDALFQPTNRSTFGPLVKPGSYFEIKYLEILGLCLVNPELNDFNVVGTFGGTYGAVTAEPFRTD
jgi:hypothetical protein